MPTVAKTEVIKWEKVNIPTYVATYKGVDAVVSPEAPGESTTTWMVELFYTDDEDMESEALAKEDSFIDLASAQAWVKKEIEKIRANS
jgi:hypothetical protein